MQVELDGLKISKFDFSELPEFGYVEYRTWFCEFSIATDSMGTQICPHGKFFGKFDFKDIMDAVNWLKDGNNLSEAKKYYRNVWFHSLNIFQGYWWKHQFEKILGKFYPVADDKNFPNWALSITSNYLLDVILYAHAMLFNNHKKYNYWEVYKRCLENKGFNHAHK